MGLLSVPLKTVLMYHADLQGESIPESYEVCDGRLLTSGQQDINAGSTYQLPDLRNRFILGADLTKAAGNAGTSGTNPTDAPGPKGNGGVNAKQLVTAELPAHSHTASTASNGAHTHSGSTAASNGAHVHTASAASNGSHSHTGSSVTSAGAHTHTGSTMTSSGNHVHGVADPGHLHGFVSQNISNLVSGAAGPGQFTAPYVFFPRDQPSTRSDLINIATTGISIQANGDHQHTLNIASDGSHSHSLTVASDGSHQHTITVDSGGAHTHTLTIASDGAHTHSVTVDDTGSGTAFDIRPRYYGLVFIMKVKK